MIEEGLKPGSVVAGRYEIIQPIGRGGMSIVYAAADLKLGRMLRAVKAMKPDAPGGRDASLDELHVLQRISHPRLPNVVDIVPPASGIPLLLVMDYVDGQTLAAAFERAGRSMRPSLAVSIGLQLCDALAYLHELQPPIAHLDVKPSNLMIDASGSIRLIDFGIAQHNGEHRDRSAPKLGTPGYAAPEQLSGGVCGPASDVYAAGVLLHALLAGGQLPEPDERRFDYLPPDVPAGCRDALARMLRRDAAARPSARQAAAMLAAAISPPAHPGPGILPTVDAAGPFTIGVASFSRGAGATFAALVLASLLADASPAALIEHPANEPELLALLAGAAAPVPEGRHGRLRPVSGRHTAWAAGTRLQVQALLDEAASGMQPDDDAALQSYTDRLRFPDRSGAERPFAVLDLSSSWAVDPGAHRAAAHCDMLVMIADGQAQRWTHRRRAGWAALKQQRADAGLPVLWIANRDASGFSARREWLALLPERPTAVLPQLPPDQLLSWLWQGKRADRHPVWRRRLEEAMRPVVDCILQGKYTIFI